MTDINDVVAAKVEEARRKAEAAKQRRVALNAARQKGLAHRHAAKLRRQAERLDTDTDSRNAPNAEGTAP